MRAALEAAALALWTGPLAAQALPPAEVYVLGEVHDNPTHHAAQARLLAEIAPNAVVFEMLSDEQAARLAPDTPRDPESLDALLGWAESGWPDIAMYAPLMADPDVPVIGAAGAPGDLSAYDLDTPLPPDQQAAREQLQADAHCGVLPEEILPDFVARQRAVDAQFAARTLAALDAHGPPVALITGNGHARADWGVPAAIARVRPDVAVIAVVQGEDGRVPPGGDVVLDAPAPERGDPCAAFQ
ncbi:MAG: ChaN family lipoprotein [Pseudomonadota bacterium]